MTERRGSGPGRGDRAGAVIVTPLARVLGGAGRAHDVVDGRITDGAGTPRAS